MTGLLSFAAEGGPGDPLPITKEMACAIAARAGEKKYGRQQIADQAPLQAELKDGIWTVKGTLPKKFTKGGVLSVRLSAKDGSIIDITHGR
ncbi:MAG TPA: NTF2 fold immunity protein [Prosthecobacter sp.]|nr:NTF2 fold immunity protein [Prosthecobacter sp.]